MSRRRNPTIGSFVESWDDAAHHPTYGIAARSTAGTAREQITLTCRIDTLDEVDDFRHGGILHYFLRQLLATSEPAGSAD